VVSIVGTRPEAIKMAPVVEALGARGALRQEIVLTGQHGSLGAWAAGTGVSVSELDLDLREQTAGEICDSLRHAIARRLLALRPDLLLVQGDTSSALSGALAAMDCGVPLAHVEAGLRSGDLQQPWPEEGNRIRIDALASLLFAPTALAAERLRIERPAGQIHLTGNTGIDALLKARPSCLAPPPSSARKQVLVTCHRRENWHRLGSVAAALKQMVRELPVDVTFLFHSNPHLQRLARSLLGQERHISLKQPVEHREMVCLMDRSWAILTDSGGIQEEGPALGKPVLVLRDVTERPEAVDTENIELVGTDPARILTAVRTLLADADRYHRMSRPSFPFGDGQAAPRIAKVIEEFLMAATGGPQSALARASRR
jgi:UDP-N-acetylglucosamine 2-epimerase (non-hydrolysing)